MNDKIHILLKDKYIPLLFSYFCHTFYVFQEHFLNKHNGAKMQIDTKKKNLYTVYKKRQEKMIVIQYSQF